MSEHPQPASAGDDRMACPHCGEEVPSGAFCGHCGGHLADVSSRHPRRAWAFAAAPHEHILQPALVSTLFPHLPHHNAGVFRRTLAGGMAVVVLLTTLHLFAAATIAAALVLPIVYILYLYEVEVYDHEPVRVIAATFLVALVLGLADSLLLGHYVGDRYGSGMRLLLAGVLTPVVGQMLMLLGPLLLLRRERFDEALDGVAFGVTSALGFSLALMLGSFWPIIVGTVLAPSELDWAARLLREGVFVFTVNAGATAAITSSVWLAHHGRNRQRHPTAWHSRPAIAALVVAAQIALGSASALIRDVFVLLMIWVVGAALLLVHLRAVIHHALLEEGGPLFIGEPSVCPECHQRVPAMLFCPACGVARSAAPKASRARP